MKSGVTRIGNERARQIGQEGWSHEHDDAHTHGELARAAACYAHPIAEMMEGEWPWEARWNKRAKHSRIRQLEIAGALIAAEIDRLQRREELASTPSGPSSTFGHGVGDRNFGVTQRRS